MPELKTSPNELESVGYEIFIGLLSILLHGFSSAGSAGPTCWRAFRSNG